MPGLQSLKLTPKEKYIGVEKYRGSTNIKDIIHVLSTDISAAYVHYMDKIGYFYCFQGACCKTAGFPKTKYVIPIMHYTSYGKDEKDYGLPIKVKYLSLEPNVYSKEIVEKQEKLRNENSSITKVDLSVTCSDEDFQKLTFQIMEGVSKRRTNKDIQDALKDQWRNYKNLINFSIARKMDEKTFIKQIASL